jgi:hypothetical protein
MSWSNQPEGRGCEVTVKKTGLLLSKLGATSTTTSPEVAPVGIVTVIEELPHELTVIAASFRSTTLLPWLDPNPVPLMAKELPTEPVVADNVDITGADVADEVTDTLSNVTVFKPTPPLLTPNPT